MFQLSEQAATLCSRVTHSDQESICPISEMNFQLNTILISFRLSEVNTIRHFRRAKGYHAGEQLREVTFVIRYFCSEDTKEFVPHFLEIIRRGRWWGWRADSADNSLQRDVLSSLAALLLMSTQEIEDVAGSHPNQEFQLV
jgi:hypothetical protein